MKTLYNRLTTLVKNGMSGIVAFCGNPKNNEPLTYVAYFHSMGYVFVQEEDESSYWSINAKKLVEKKLLAFSKRSYCASAGKVAKLESELLDRIFSDLLWHMAHEMDTENHTYETSDKWEIPCVLDDYDDFAPFTLGFASDLESDALGFFKSSQADICFSVGEKKYYVVCDTDKKESWTLYHAYPETFVDEQTGDEYIIQRLLRIISCDNWRSLYAASRAVIYSRRNVI